MLKINLSRQVEKSLKKLPPKQGKQAARKIMALREDPYPNDVKKLANSSYLRVDVGEYRLIYTIDGNTLKLALFGKRNDDEVYKKLKRLKSTR